MLRTISLQKRIVIFVTLVTVVMMSVIVSFDSYSLQRSVEETYVSQLNGMTIAINGRYEESHSIEDVQQIFDYIQYKNNDILELTLYGKDEILASTNRNRVGQPSPPEMMANMQDTDIHVAHLFENENGIPTGLLTAPMREDGVTVGAIEMLLNTSENAALIKKRIRFSVLVGLGITLLLLAVLSLIIRKLLIHPLLQIRQAAVSVREGAPYTEIPLDASLEIREVATAFNDMVRNLEGRYNELQAAMGTIQRTQKQLVESEKMGALGSLVAGVSHEINTPIGIGVTAASFMEEKSKDFLALYQDNKMKRSDLEDYLSVVRETTGMIQTNLQRASELIKSFKQVAVDRSVETKRTFAVKEYIQEVLISLQPNLKKTKHHVVVSGPDGVELYSDPGAISQIVTNLIMNSIIHAYTPNDEGTIRISIEKFQKFVNLTYSDDGRGMPQEVVDQIFNPFFTTNRSGGGTGLGMHIVYNLVTQSLGGTIDCESQVGLGTTFRIRIPTLHKG